MRQIALAAILAATVAGAAHAQLGTTHMDHDVQKIWDDIFDPNSHGDRTNWERRRDEQRRDWCRANTGYPRCAQYR